MVKWLNLDWNTIQLGYDSGLTLRQVMAQYGVSGYHIFCAKKSGKFNSRTLSASLTGRIFSESHKKSISAKRRNRPGKVRSAECRLKISLAARGRKLQPEVRNKIRLKLVERYQQLGLGGGRVDAGATEFFNNLNRTQGFHVQHPNVYFKELGYFADGYDPVLHAWFEYDTPVHRRWKEHDQKRQQEIIDYFKVIGRPLTAFYRVNVTGVGEPGMKNFI
jgi:hypothetical protein